ncbi:response regulator transcription factor [Streptomyces sp. G45]|uniref:response regulator transcription factor n=1 Tax=Streptomyces sp. G45 TaxID=3406627 RepID=UPI003C2155D9
MQVSLPPDGGAEGAGGERVTTADSGEASQVRGALLRLRRATGLPVAFGGLADGEGHIRIGELSGTSTHVLSGLAISSGNGLGGKATALARPCAVADYRASRRISHEYDAAVEAEGLRSVVAVPLVVRRRVRGLLYGALRTTLPLGDRVLDAAVAAARDVEQALVVRDETRALLAVAGGAGGDGDAAGAGGGGSGPGAGGGGGCGCGGACGGAVWERMREAHAALRALATRINDPVLRDEVLAACGTLAAAPRGAAVTLAPREVDVLAWVALGATNAEVAERLGLRPETVKSYLRSAMRRLGARTRGEAVSAARRAALLP